jgi:uncharacterized integral membrane protein
MRILSYLIALLVLLAGLLFGALNPAAVRIDLYFIAFELALGPAPLLATLTGAVLGGLAVALGVAVPLRRRLSRRPRVPVPTGDRNPGEGA